MLAWHLMIRLADDRVLTPSAASARRFARVVHDTCTPGPLLAFRAADTHAHLLLRCERDEAGLLARRLEVRLHWRLPAPVPFSRAHLTPVATQAHLVRAFWYILRQDRHHGTHHDPWHEASALPDLLGLRPRGQGLVLAVRAHLPRVSRSELLDALGTDLCAEPVWQDLPDAAAAAAALPNLCGNHPDAAHARRAAIAAAEDLDSATLAVLLKLSRRAVQRARCQPTDRTLSRAILGQLSLRAALGTEGQTHSPVQDRT